MGEAVRSLICSSTIRLRYEKMLQMKQWVRKCKRRLKLMQKWVGSFLDFTCRFACAGLLGVLILLLLEDVVYLFSLNLRYSDAIINGASGLGSFGAVYLTIREIPIRKVILLLVFSASALGLERLTSPLFNEQNGIK